MKALLSPSHGSGNCNNLWLLAVRSLKRGSYTVPMPIVSWPHDLPSSWSSPVMLCLFNNWYFPICRKSIWLLNTRISSVAVNTGYVRFLECPFNSYGPLFSDVDCNTASHAGHCALFPFQNQWELMLCLQYREKCGMMKSALSANYTRSDATSLV